MLWCEVTKRYLGQWNQKPTKTLPPPIILLYSSLPTTQFDCVLLQMQTSKMDFLINQYHTEVIFLSRGKLA